MPFLPLAVYALFVEVITNTLDDETILAPPSNWFLRQSVCRLTAYMSLVKANIMMGLTPTKGSLFSVPFFLSLSSFLCFLAHSRLFFLPIMCSGLHFFPWSNFILRVLLYL